MNNIRQRHWVAWGLSLLLMSGLLAGCSGDGDTAGSSQMDSDANDSGAAVTAYSDWDTDDAVRVTLGGDSITVEGTGASAEGGRLTITQAGTYVLSGTLDDGQIYIEAGKEDLVQLVLNGAALSCSDSAPIHAAKAGQTVLILADGTDNSVRDGESYAYPDETADEPDAAIFCKDNLTITGDGSLRVAGNFNNGIGAKDDLVILGGAITVEAVNHGIRGRDSVTILGGDLTIQAGNDGIQSNNANSDDVGWVRIEDGNFQITSGRDGIQAETDLTITGGKFSILSGGGNDAQGLESTESYKGLKAGADLTIAGGSFTIDSADDTLHANGDIAITGGEFALASGDDGIHADGDLGIHGGTIEISTSYEGLEGSTVTLTGGYVRLRATDDGVNAAGGTDSSGEGRFGQDRFRADENLYIDISGGTLIVDAMGDGLDSNGNIFMSGGTVVVHGPTSGGDAPLDFDGNFTISGGVLVAAGSSGMAQMPGSDSTQASLMLYYSSTHEAGTTIHLADADGNSLLSFTPEKSYQNLVVSIPQLEDGATYTVYTGGTASGEEVGGLILGGSYFGGSQVVQVTLSGASTRISDTGEAVTGGMGMGGPGGGPGGGRWQPDSDFQPGGARPGDGNEGPSGGGGLGGQPPSDGDPPAPPTNREQT